jgi:hypothetical protein
MGLECLLPKESNTLESVNVMLFPEVGIKEEVKMKLKGVVNING